jgi:hypothetical protein
VPNESFSQLTSANRTTIDSPPAQARPRTTKSQVTATVPAWCALWHGSYTTKHNRVIIHTLPLPATKRAEKAKRFCFQLFIFLTFKKSNETKKTRS